MPKPPCHNCAQPASRVHRGRFSCGDCSSRNTMRFVQREIQLAAKRLVHPPLKRLPPVALCLSGGAGSGLLAAGLEFRASALWVRRAIHVREGDDDVAEAW